MEVGYCWLHSYDNDNWSNFDFSEKADKTKAYLLVCYGDDYSSSRRQVLYNESNLFTRDGFVKMENMIWSDWTELTSSSTSSPIMYIHVTSEEKDGETVYKSDKTYEEIKEAVDSRKSPVAIYNCNCMFFNYFNDYGNEQLIFVSDTGCVSITKTSVDFVQKQLIIPLEIIIQDTGERVINSEVTGFMLSLQIAEMCYGTYPQILCSVNKNNTKYCVCLSFSGINNHKNLIFSTVANINGKLTYYYLNINHPKDTSIWKYEETEI